MMLLDGSFWGTYPAWGSFIVALGGFILLLIKSLRSRIDHMEGVVEELQKQNETLLGQNIIFKEDLELNKKRFEHETRVNIFETRPVFKIHHRLPFRNQNQMQIVFINEGTKAAEVKIEGAVVGGANWTVLKAPEFNVPSGGKTDTMIECADEHFEGVKFDLTYYDEFDNKHIQTVQKKLGGNFQIDLPKV